ncbi:putative reverse transcriptase domain-containing protein [Tanacetum coccineum]
MLRGLDQLMEMKEGGDMYLLWVLLIGDVRILMMDEAYASRYLVHPGADKTYYDLEYVWLGPCMEKDIGSLYKVLGTRLDMSTAYHLQTDGQSERTIQTRGDVLRAGHMFFGLKLEKFGRLDQNWYKRQQIRVEVGDKVMLEVSSWKEVVHFGKKEMLAPRYKYLADTNLHVHFEEIKVDKTLRFVKEPVEIIDRGVKSLKRIRIPIVKSIGTRSEDVHDDLSGVGWQLHVLFSIYVYQHQFFRNGCPSGLWFHNLQNEKPYPAQGRIANRKGFVEAKLDEGLLEIFGFKQGWHASLVMVDLCSAKHIAQGKRGVEKPVSLLGFEKGGKTFIKEVRGDRQKFGGIGNNGPSILCVAWTLLSEILGNVRTLMMDKAHALRSHVFFGLKLAKFGRLDQNWYKRQQRRVEVGDKVMLEVSSWKVEVHFGKKEMLAPRYYWTDANLHAHLEEIKVDKTLRFVEEPVEIIDREVKSLKHSKILIVKSIGTRSEE